MIRRVLLSTLGLLALAGGYFLFGQANTIIHILKLPSYYYAKEVCTCHFVLGQSVADCVAETSELIPPGEVRREGQGIFSRKFGFSAQSTFDPRKGCEVTQSPF